MKLNINLEIELTKDEVMAMLMHNNRFITLDNIVPETKEIIQKSNNRTKGPVTLKKRECTTCGIQFQPQGNRQMRCSIKCGLKPKTQKEKLKKKPCEPIEKTMKEIELRRTERNTKPYEFAT